MVSVSIYNEKDTAIGKQHKHNSKFIGLISFKIRILDDFLNLEDWYHFEFCAQLRFY
jgi:hypothetical protein